MAAQWAATGDTRLAKHLAARRRTIEIPSEGSSESSKPRGARPSFDLSTGDAPSPTTTPDASIYYSSTIPFVSGSVGTIISSVTYFGNIAVNSVTFTAKGPGTAIPVPPQTVVARGLGDAVPCVGSYWQCLWIFRLQTVVTVNLGSSCGVTLSASGNHTAQWTSPTAYKLPGATWGSTFSSDPVASADNGSCTPTCQDVQASNYGGPLPCTYPPPPPSGSGTPPPGVTTGDTYTYPGAYYATGHWECTIWNYGTEYETRNCIWIASYGNRLPLAPTSFARFAAPGAASPSSSADPLASVFVVVSDQVPANAVAVIERHKTGPFKNVLLVPSSNVRPAVFVALMQALYDSRAKDGESPAKELSITLSGSVLDQQIPSADRDYAAAFTAQIASAKQGNAGAYGNRPIIEFKLAAKK